MAEYNGIAAAHLRNEADTVVEAVGLDKKRAEGGISFVLLTALGRAEPRKMETDRLLEQLKPICEG